MKILFFVTEDWYFMSHRFPIALEAKNNGYDVVILSNFSNYRSEIEQSGIRTISLKHCNRRSMNIFFEIISFFEIFIIYFRERPNIVHQVAIKPVIYGSICAKFLNIKCVVNALGGLGLIFTSKKLSYRIVKFFLDLILRFIHKNNRSIIILQSKDNVDYFLKNLVISADNIILIPSAGVDLKKFTITKLPNSPPVVMLASRMLWDKGVEKFVSAARLLKEENLTARFVLVGKPDIGNPNSISVQQLVSWNKEGFIEWWGHQNNMTRVLSQATIICLPSFYGEGTPKILIEAMACGRPIITTNISGCKDLVRDSDAGLLVDPNNVEDLINAIRTLIKDRSLCLKMGFGGRLFVKKHHDINDVVNITLNIYKKLLLR